MFTSIISSGDITLLSVLICTGVSLVLGTVIAVVYMMQGNYTKNFIISLVLLPALVQCVILMVNGNLGAGIAVAGAFSLVRFRSAQGNAKEICAIFFSMAIGLATGMGYVVFAAIFTIIIGSAFLIIAKTSFGEPKIVNKELKVTIPENLNYIKVFDDLFAKYTTEASLVRAKTTNLGSMYELTYSISLKDEKQEKNLIDDIRCRNGNLTVICGMVKESKDAL